MLRCWLLDHRQRPTFHELAEAFARIYAACSYAEGRPIHCHVTADDVTVTPCPAHGNACQMCARDCRAGSAGLYSISPAGTLMPCRAGRG
jgi:hypothetical protein